MLIVTRLSFGVLAAFLILAFGLRLYRFGDIPHGVNRDEAAIGYTAKLLLSTGREEHGQILPLKFESFGDWKQPVYIYMTIPFVWLFGLNPQSVRLLSLLAGLGMILGAFFLTQKVSEKQPANIWPGILTVMFLAVNPWHFHFSRLALEAMVAASLMCLGILALSSKSIKWLFVGILLLIISLFTYHAALIAVPIWFLGYIWLYKNKLKSKLFKITSGIFFLVWIIVLIQAWRSPEQTKATGTSIFNLNNEQLWQEIYQYRTGSIGSKLINNQYLYFARTLSLNYIKNWSPNFLWIQGGNHPQYNVPGFGNFLKIELVLALIGILGIVKRKSRIGYLLLIALVAAPLPAALTKDGAHSTRSIFMLPYVQIFAALGTMTLIEKLKKRWQKIICLVLVLGCLIFQANRFIGFYFNSYPAISDRKFDGYMRETSLFLNAQVQTGRVIYITYPFESPYIYYAFYTDMDPNLFLDSIQFYPRDKLGFRYAKKLLTQNYIPNTSDLEDIDPSRLDNALVLARIGEKSQGEVIRTFYDLTGKPQIVAKKID